MWSVTFELGPAIDGDHHYALLEHVLKLEPAGTALEFGVGAGTSTRIIAAHMPVVGFDSFTGLPEDWRDEYPKGSFAHPPPAIANARLVIGQFTDTLPGFSFPNPIGLVHIDCDLYSSTATALKWVGPHLKPGCVVVFDEFHGYDGAEKFEQHAWNEYTASRPDLYWEPIGHDFEQAAYRCV